MPLSAPVSYPQRKKFTTDLCHSGPYFVWMRKYLFAVALSLLAVAVNPPGVLAVDVIGDGAQERFVGSGGIILPSHVDPGHRHSAATCVGCRWSFREPCPDIDTSQLPCFSPMPCPADTVLLAYYFSSDAGNTWVNRGLVCMDSGGPRTVVDLSNRVKDVVIERLPPLNPTHQPNRGVIPRIPVLLHSGQNPLSEFTMRIVGFDVRVNPTVNWIWTFPSGSTLHTASPGSRYPNTDVARTFRTSGVKRVTCQAIWSGTFTVGDLGPFAIQGEIRQSQALAIRVADARSRLIRGPGVR